MQWWQWLIVAVFVMCGIPVLVYMSVGMGTIAYHRAKQILARKKKESEDAGTTKTPRAGQA